MKLKLAWGSKLICLSTWRQSIKFGGVCTMLRKYMAVPNKRFLHGTAIYVSGYIYNRAKQ